MSKPLAKRMKEYEASTETFLLSQLPIIVRLDGRSFSKFTKGMDRPFDRKFRQVMIDVTKFLVEQTNAKIGYTQSDEITLILHNEDYNSSTFFNGRVQKLTSTLSALTSVRFLLEMQKHFPEKVSDPDRLPTFDARVFIVPTKTEAANNLVWRVKDCCKNSVAMVAQSQFSHNELKNLNSKELQYKLLTERNINWNDYSSNEKQGTFVRKEQIQIKLDEERLAKIQDDKKPKDGIVTRSRVVEIDMPNFLKVENRVEVIFNGEQPIINKSI